MIALWNFSGSCGNIFDCDIETNVTASKVDNYLQWGSLDTCDQSFDGDCADDGQEAAGRAEQQGAGVEAVGAQLPGPGDDQRQQS